MHHRPRRDQPRARDASAHSAASARARPSAARRGSDPARHASAAKSISGYAAESSLPAERSRAVLRPAGNIPTSRSHTTATRRLIPDSSLLVPDASFYGLQVAWLGYYRLQQISPSLSWGVAIGACSILLVDAACRRAEPALLSLGLLLAFATTLFKAQIAAVLVPALLLWSVIAFQGLGIRVCLAIAGLTAFTLAVIVETATHLSLAPSIAFAKDRGLGYLEVIAGGIRNESTREMWQQFIASESLVPGVTLVLVASFGALPFVYLATIMIRRSRKMATGRCERIRFWAGSWSELFAGVVFQADSRVGERSRDCAPSSL